eukprot:CAMPEP_0179320642 /NCGR_PEP_ID=MMETSP0797-20121207/58160_1 /TAXON_ID=47934 /ORGANISM="Dinophysis acuminata, Strain DAEP01" /LENGTH=79 /DNA_ID=CAMNT_0021032159 /DNA_START=16 /DNA_END=252 /DNA_ORIENTATION=+
MKLAAHRRRGTRTPLRPWSSPEARSTHPMGAPMPSPLARESIHAHVRPLAQPAAPAAVPTEAKAPRTCAQHTSTSIRLD